VRMATVIGVLDQAFDVLVPEFGIGQSLSSFIREVLLIRVRWE
jgi:hypothetical protein